MQQRFKVSTFVGIDYQYTRFQLQLFKLTSISLNYWKFKIDYDDYNFYGFSILHWPGPLWVRDN
jgi:hypothetical protein